MLGRMPFVSISDKRLGGMENSSFRYLSAIRALEFSTSRIVSPSFSRRVRRLFPAGSIEVPQVRSGNHTKGVAACARNSSDLLTTKFVTNSEHTEMLIWRGHSSLDALESQRTSFPFVSVTIL